MGYFDYSISLISFSSRHGLIPERFRARCSSKHYAITYGSRIIIRLSQWCITIYIMSGTKCLLLYWRFQGLTVVVDILKVSLSYG